MKDFHAFGMNFARYAAAAAAVVATVVGSPFHSSLHKLDFHRQALRPSRPVAVAELDSKENIECKIM